MINLIKSIDNLIDRGKRLVTISEVTHRSYSSHTLHYNLVRQLHQSKKNRLFSSERLGPIDALLLNLWLQGKLTVSLKYLYDYILPFGGLGTYRWIKYFKTQPLTTFQIVGLDVDTLPSNNKKLLSVLKNITSKDFGDQLTLDYQPPLPKNIHTEIDQIVYDAIIQFQNERKHPQKRLKIWADNMNKILKENPNDSLFINGFHLSRHQSGLLNKLYISQKSMLVLGMASFVKEIPIITLTPKWFKEHNLKFPDEYGNEDFFKKYFEFYDTIPYKKIVRILNKNIKKSTDVSMPSPFEEKYCKDFKLIPTKKKHDKSDYIDHSMGGMAEPYVKNTLRIDKGGFAVSDYDFVIAIPFSKYRKDMRY